MTAARSLASPLSLGVASGLAALGLGLTGFIPLFGGPGYEASLAAGLLLPTTAALVTAIGVVRDRPEPLAALGRGLAIGLAAATAGFLVTLLHGLRVGFCDAAEGSSLYWLGGGAGALVGGVWGGVAGLVASLAPRRRGVLAVLLALAGPALGVLWSLVRFYATPMVFAFDPFFGYFSGPLYDTVIDGGGRLATYRAGTALALGAALALAAQLRRAERGLRVVWTFAPALPLLGALATAGTVAHAAAGARLGHWSTARSIEHALGARLDGARCALSYPASLRRAEAELVLRECEVHVRELEAYLGATGPAVTRVFLFASAEEKGRYMGASRTQIAKPWRAEIYLQNAPYPHPVLRHELAHVVAGAFGRGPFRVAGPWGGLIPDPGRIEGVAEAAARDDDDDLGLEDWARAMREVGELPPLGGVFRLGFLGQNASKAYTVAGAFVAWLIETRGAETVRRWYAGERLEVVTGGPGLEALEREWHRSLDAVVVPPRALPGARARFDRPAIFARRCPRVVDRLERRALSELGAGQGGAAAATFRDLLELDPGHLRARLGLGTCALRQGDAPGAATALDRLASETELGVYARGIARERRGDLALLAGDEETARAAFAEAAETEIDAGRRRTLAVKTAFAGEPRKRAAVVELLIGDRDREPDFALAAARLGEWAAASPTDGTPLYLLGKNLYQQGRWAAAAEYLDRALRRELALPELREEAFRTRLLTACALGDLDAARRAFAGFSALQTPSRERRRGTGAVATRCGL